MDTFLRRTVGAVPTVSVIERVDCIFWQQASTYCRQMGVGNFGNWASIDNIHVQLPLNQKMFYNDAINCYHNSNSQISETDLFPSRTYGMKVYPVTPIFLVLFYVT